jgi:glycosyltransferase involved in cell wall biosynthesis
MDLLVDGQPLQIGGLPAAGRVALHLLATLARRHGDWQIQVVANSRLSRFEFGGLPVVTFDPPPELAERPDPLDIYYADWLLSREPAAYLIPGLFPRKAVIPHFIGHLPRIAALIDPTAWSRAVETFGAYAKAGRAIAHGLNLLLRADRWFDFVPLGSSTWIDQVDCEMPPRLSLPFGLPGGARPKPGSPPDGLAGRAYLLLDANGLPAAEMSECVAIHQALPADVRARCPFVVIAPDWCKVANHTPSEYVLLLDPDPATRAALFHWCRAVVIPPRETDTRSLAEALLAGRPVLAPIAACGSQPAGPVHTYDPRACAGGVANAWLSVLNSSSDLELSAEDLPSLDEAADALNVALAETVRRPMPSRRRRIAWVSTASGEPAVRRWTDGLRSALATAFDVETVGAEGSALRPDELAATQRFAPHDLVIYHGRNHPSDAPIVPFARAVPGLIVVHDTRLDELIAAVPGAGPSADPLADFATAIGPGNVLACCSPEACTRFRRLNLLPSFPMPRGVPAARRLPVGYARQQLNLPLGLYLIGVWIGEGGEPRSGALFEAVAGLPQPVRDRVRVVLRGRPSVAVRERLRRRTQELGVPDHALWHFDEDPDEASAYARAIDVWLTLGGSRDGEFALLALGALAAGTVCVAPDGELPGIPVDPVTIGIRPEEFVADLRGELVRLYHSPPLRQRLGRAGRLFAAEEAPIESAAAHLIALIEQVVGDREVSDAAWASTVGAAVGGPLSEPFAAEWAGLRSKSTRTRPVRELRLVARPVPGPGWRPTRAAHAAAGRRLWVLMSVVLGNHHGHYTGISRMVVSVTREIIRQGLAAVRFCRFRGGGPNSDLVEVDEAAARDHIFREVTAPVPELVRHTIDRPIEFLPGDVLVCPEVYLSPNFAKLLRHVRHSSPAAIVPFIHDIIAARFPHFFGGFGLGHFWSWAAGSIATADLILTNSRNTETDIKWFADVNDLAVPPVEVIRLGDEDLTAVPTRHIRQVAGLTPADRFAVVCCTIEPRKNHRVLYETWRKLLAVHGPERTPMLVCVGRVGWHVQEFVDQLRADPYARDHIVLLEDINDSELAWLYKHCLFTLYPSLYEGWGIPVGESLAAGKLAIVSNSSSLPEIGGDLVDYHDPVDVPGCYSLVERAAFDDGYRAAREARIRAEYRSTSWATCARQIVERMERHLGALVPHRRRLAA